MDHGPGAGAISGKQSPIDQLSTSARRAIINRYRPFNSAKAQCLPISPSSQLRADTTFVLYIPRPARMPPAGYIGPLPGLYFDPIRGKYFTDRPSTTGSGPGPSTSASRNAAINTATNESGRPPRRPVTGRGRKAVPQTARPAIESTSTTTQASGSGATSTSVRRGRNHLGARGVVSLARSRTGGTVAYDGYVLPCNTQFPG